MTSNLRISFPSASRTVCTCSATPATGYGLQNLIGGSRAQYFKLAAATTNDLYFEYPSGVGNHIILSRANLLQAAGCNKLVVRHSQYSYQTPSSISGLKLWLDSNRGVSTSSGVVDSWADLSGQGNNGTSSGTARPLYTAASSGVNGNATITFSSASSQYIAVDGLASLFNGNDKAHTVFLVFKKTTNVGTQGAFVAGRSSSTTPIHYYYSNAASTYSCYRRDDASSAAFANGTAVPNTNTTVYSAVYSGTALSTYVNGTVDINAAAINVGTQTIDSVTIGAWRTTSVLQPYNGQINEILVYDTALGATDRQNIEGYLTNKWVTAPSLTDLSFASATLYGPRNEDYIATFSAANTVHTIIQQGTASSSVYPQGKHFIGTLIDLGREPIYGQVKTSEEKTRHARERAREYQLEWRGISHAIKTFFVSAILEDRDTLPLMLYDAADYFLEGKRILNGVIKDAKITSTATDNTIAATFEELI